VTPVQGNERFDIVDEDGNVIGSALRRECHGNPALLHRVIHVVIVNGRGDLLLQKRSRTFRFTGDVQAR